MSNPTHPRSGSLRQNRPPWVLPALLVALVASPGVARAQGIPLSEDCVSCHLELNEDRLVAPARDFFQSDLHAEIGFGCLDCHGSGGLEDLDPARGFLASPRRQEIPTMCGSCHSDAAFMRQFNPSLRVDQVTEYWTSKHGTLLRDANDPDVATCVDCHPAHIMRPVSDPESSVYPTNVVTTCGRCHGDPQHMAGRAVGSNQVTDYLGSVHGRMLMEEGDVSAPVCNDCHGNHGAAPPGMGSVRNVCGQCHAVMADYYGQSGHQEIFDEEDLPSCATCHGAHDIQLVSEASLGARAEEVCMQCHAPTDPAGLAFQDMAQVLDSLVHARDQSLEVLEEAENVGMEVSQAIFELEDVRNALTKARSAIHTFSADPVRQEAAAGFELTQQARNRGLAALEEYDFRRVGLGVFAGIVLLMVAGLLMKIRYSDQWEGELLAELSRFFKDTMAGGPAGPSSEELRMAACALLVEASHAHAALTRGERRYVSEVVRTESGLPRSQADELVRLVEEQASSPVEIGAFARLLVEHHTDAQRARVAAELWKLVFADQEGLATREIAILHTVAKLLHMDDEQMAAARRTVEVGARPARDSSERGGN